MPPQLRRLTSFVLVFHITAFAFQLRAEDSNVPAGHSFHGEAFNEGPRQSAVIIPGMASLEFPTSTKSKVAQEFFLQGVAQLHGFWYLEAERSFRQAAKEDPKLAIAYWGMAMANINNSDRARGLIDTSMKLRKDSSAREKRYIEALERFIPKKKAESKDDEEEGAEKKKAAEEKEKEDKKKRGERYIADMEKIIHEHPEDIEARAFLVVHMWQADRYGVKLTSRYAVNALIGEILAANPQHPVHHYCIHLWDSARPDNALKSAAMCGPSSPGIAHMWHMPGHIYSKLKRYHDAAWQQEASARVDHAHMNRARLMPDQIHNFAHNNEWLTRNLVFLGRVNEALDQARNLVSLPRHPNYNTLKKRGSYKYGRTRLIQVLTQYGLWKELIAESKGHYLAATDDEAENNERTTWLAVAHFLSGDRKSGGQKLRSLQRQRLEIQEQLLDLADSVGEPDKKEKDDQKQSEGDDKNQPTADELKKKLEALKPLIARAASAAAVVRKDKSGLQKRIKDAKLDDVIQAEWLGAVGDYSPAIKLCEDAVKKDKSQVRPLAVLVHLLWKKGDKAGAKKRFEELRKVAADADLDTPMLKRLQPIANAVKAPADWRIAREEAQDIGERPPLDSLGTFRWQPYDAPEWQLTTSAGEARSSSEFSGKPRLVIFYLGFGCLHCVEQLEAFGPKIKAFQDAGIDVIGISTENPEQLKKGIENFDEELKIPLLADGDAAAFKSFRCWDDFENQPLHGTFLIDADNRVRWQDISYEPFTDADFVLEEAKRLLALPK